MGQAMGARWAACKVSVLLSSVLQLVNPSCHGPGAVPGPEDCSVPGRVLSWVESVEGEPQ